MLSYNDRKSFITKNIIVNLTSIGIANLCDYVICDRYDDNYGKSQPSVDINKIYQLNNGDKLFLNGFNLQNYPDIINIIVTALKNKNIKLNFYIGVIEPTLNNNIINILLPYSIKIYCTNNIHPSCKILPIGLRDGEEVHPNHKNFSGKDILDEIKVNRNKKYLCLLCFTKSTDRTRVDCENKLGLKDYIYNLNNNKTLRWNNKGGDLVTNKQQSIHCGAIPQWIFYEYCHESHYTLSPKGLGEDTHRFFEAIALNSIPIVKKTNTPFDETFKFFPCLVVNDWDECTKEFLLDNLSEKIESMNNFHKKYPEFLTNVETIKQMLNDI
jgi:hypothetical protein